jgi:hypothetical protein
MGLFLQVFFTYYLIKYFYSTLIMDGNLFCIHPVSNSWASIAENQYNKGLFGGHK